MTGWTERVALGSGWQRVERRPKRRLAGQKRARRGNATGWGLVGRGGGGALEAVRGKARYSILDLEKHVCDEVT